MLTYYVIYNYSPVKIVKKCKFCRKQVAGRVRRWLFKFTRNYFDVEGPSREYFW